MLPRIPRLGAQWSVCLYSQKMSGVHKGRIYQTGKGGKVMAHKCRDWEYRHFHNCNSRPCPKGVIVGTCKIKDALPRKPKTVTVKAWAHISDRSERFIEARTAKPDRRKYNVPCTITYTPRKGEK